jgi:hypothetical protein
MRVACPLDRFCDLVASGRTQEIDPRALAWGHLGDDTKLEDFANVGLGPAESAEGDALLRLRPGHTYNFSNQEIERFATARVQLGKRRSPEAVQADGVPTPVRPL